MAEFQNHLSIVLIFCSCLLYIATSGTSDPKNAEDDDSKLRLVSAVFRHSDRTVDKSLGESYPNDPYGNYNFYPDGEGQLTNAGKIRAYKLGLLLRNRYNSFLGDVYYQPNVYAHSTYIIRAKMTLQLVLAALYPPADIQKWNSELLWQPTDFIYVSSKDDLLAQILSPTYKEAYNNMLQSSEVKKKIKKFNVLMKNMSDHTGKNITSVKSLYTLYTTLFTQSNMGLKLPYWTEDVFRNGTLLDAAVLSLELFCYDKLNNLNGGVLLNRIIEDMNKVINGTLADRKINLFSAHDIHVAALLYALNIFKHHFPAYTSTVIIELREKDGEYFVKVLYYLGTPSDMLEMKIPGCEVLCPYDKFIELTSESIKPFKQPKSEQSTSESEMNSQMPNNIFTIE